MALSLAYQMVCREAGNAAALRALGSKCLVPAFPSLLFLYHRARRRGVLGALSHPAETSTSQPLSIRMDFLFWTLIIASPRGQNYPLVRRTEFV